MLLILYRSSALTQHAFIQHFNTILNLAPVRRCCRNACAQVYRWGDEEGCASNCWAPAYTGLYCAFWNPQGCPWARLSTALGNMKAASSTALEQIYLAAAILGVVLRRQHSGSAVLFQGLHFLWEEGHSQFCSCSWLSDVNESTSVMLPFLHDQESDYFRAVQEIGRDLIF